MNPSMTFWDWAAAAYARPDAEAALLALQDEHGQCVVHLLWIAWMAALGKGASGEGLAAGAALARTWDVDVTGPLRQVRRRLKNRGGQALYDQVKAAEMAAEKVLMERLEGLAAASPGPAAASMSQALGDAAARWGPPAPMDRIEALAGALD
jgi:uncharacterized protein (TIGR02444 family)